MHNILLVTAAQGYIPMAVKEKFEENENYKVLISEARVDSVNGVKEDFSAILLYVDENVISQQVQLVHIHFRKKTEQMIMYSL